VGLYVSVVLKKNRKIEINQGFESALAIVRKYYTHQATRSATVCVRKFSSGVRTSPVHSGSLRPLTV